MLDRWVVAAARILGAFAIAALCIPDLITAQSSGEDVFEQFKRAQETEFDSVKQSFDDEFLNFVREQQEEFEQFKKEVDKRWTDHLYPSKKVYVEYGNDYQSRTSIDFEKGEVEASVIVDASAGTNEVAQASARLKQQVAGSVTTTGRVNQYSGESGIMVAQAPLVEGVITDNLGNAVGVHNADAFADELVTARGVEVDTIISDDGLVRIKLSVSYAMVPDGIKKLATRFVPLAKTYARQYDLDVRLVMAIIHTESYFNPMAISHVPAYGLMQVVPVSAGRDASKLLYGTERLLTPDFLYDPQNNMMVGCAYLSVLRKQYLKGVAEDQLAYPCIIAAYNGGIGTVCKALTGARGLDGLATTVQQMEYDKLVSSLTTRLPYQETRDYLTRVLARMPLYDEWTQ